MSPCVADVTVDCVLCRQSNKRTLLLLLLLLLLFQQNCRRYLVSSHLLAAAAADSSLMKMRRCEVTRTANEASCNCVLACCPIRYETMRLEVGEEPT